METIKVICSNPNNKRGWKIINKSDMIETDKPFTDEKVTTKKPRRKVIKNDKVQRD